jgi:hypothetical protein
MIENWGPLISYQVVVRLIPGDERRTLIILGYRDQPRTLVEASTNDLLSEELDEGVDWEFESVEPLS